MLAVHNFALGFAAAPLPMTVRPVRNTVVKMETVEDLRVLAVKANPVIGYWVRLPAARPQCLRILRTSRASLIA